MAKKYDRSFLEKVAEELNKVMKLTPPIEASMPDDETLLGHIKYEATGGGKVKAAIRALDFENPEDPKALVFSEKVADFFVEVGVWDRDEECVIMPKKSSHEEASAEEKLPSDETVERKASKKDAESKTKEEEMSTKKAAVKKDEKKPAAAPKKDKKKATVNKATAKKEKKEIALSCFGHREGSNGAKMDKAINAGKPLAAIAKEAGVDDKRVRGHVQHLKGNHDIHVTFDEAGKVSVKKIKK